ncbi:MAG TPA: DUF4395 domain-containing protein [Sediminibacterium sp.]|nr:DUF4395 domain-containing protein [Sediminibacterium sp.]
MAVLVNCPVDFVAINENKVRVTGLLVFLLSVAYLLTGTPYIPAFLLIDFYLRAFHQGTYSPLNRVSTLVEKMGWISVKWTDRAPKRFAARIGFLLTDLIFIASIVELHAAAYWLAVVLILFSFLESFFGFCAGCYVYSLYNKILQPSK